MVAILANARPPPEVGRSVCCFAPFVELIITLTCNLLFVLLCLVLLSERVFEPLRVRCAHSQLTTTLGLIALPSFLPRKAVTLPPC